MKAPKLTIRVDLGGGRALGPGKVRLLEAIDKAGSISEAARELNISYPRAWRMVDDLNGCFRARVIKPQRGGADGGDLTRPNHSRQAAVRPLIRSERLLIGPAHSPHPPRRQTSTARVAGVPPTIDLGATVKSP
jgi:molybdate transport system regulatory protein